MFHDLASWFTGLVSTRKDCIEFAESFLCNFEEDLIRKVERTVIYNRDHTGFETMFDMTVSGGGREIPRGLIGPAYGLDESDAPATIVDEFKPRFYNAIHEGPEEILRVFLSRLDHDTLLLTVFAPH